MDFRGFSIHGGVGMTRGLEGRPVARVFCAGGMVIFPEVCGGCEKVELDDVSACQLDADAVPPAFCKDCVIAGSYSV